MTALEPASVVGIGERRGTRRGLIALGIYLAVYGSWQALHWGPLKPALIGDLAFLPINAVAVYASLRAARRVEHRRVRQAWLLAAVALALFLLGGVAQLVVENVTGPRAFPSIADVPYLAFYPVMLAAVLRFPASHKPGAKAPELMLDIAIVAVGASILLFYVAVGPDAVLSAPTLKDAAYSVAYPLGDMILIVAVAALLLRGSLASCRPALQLILAGLVVLIAADMTYGYLAANASYTGGDPVDVLWMAALALYTVAPTLQRPQPADSGELAESGPYVLGRHRPAWLPYVAVMVAFGLVALEQSEDPLRDQLLSLIAVGLGALVVTRQLLAQRRLLAMQSELRQARDELAALATTDALTGLANHRAIVENLDLELGRARRHERPFALLFLDIDHFKRLNDSCGHLAGDRALTELGHVLRGSLREIDSVGRWGGEEFVVVLPESDGAAAQATAERIREAIAEHQFSAGEGLTCSIGVASYPDDATERSELVGLADMAMYVAKRRGRNCIVSAAAAVRSGETPTLRAVCDPVSDAVFDTEPTAGRAAARGVEPSRPGPAGERDALTGLYSRRRLSAELDLRLRQAGGAERAGALVLIDVDNFKLVNETHGTAAGDRVLKAVAEAVSSGAADAGLAARLGSDEFAVLLPDASEKDAIVRANAIRGQLHARVSGPGVQSSAGVCLFGDGAELSANDVMIGADIALYQAKERGGDRTEVYRGQAGAVLTWVDRISSALAEERFVLYGQPIVDLGTGEHARQELLIRMISEDGDVISPDMFLPTAERFGLVTAIDRWVTEQALTIARGGPVSFNLSGNSIGDSEILGRVEQAVAAGLDPASVIFEVTETSAMTNLDAARRFATRLAEIGCEVALDDFGTGFASFTYLKHLPVRYLKIDMEFVRELAGNTTDQEVVQAICAVAHSLGKQTIAEGVESECALAMLRGYGVDFAQGYFVGRPKRISPPTALERSLRESALRRLPRAGTGPDSESGEPHRRAAAQ